MKKIDRVSRILFIGACLFFAFLYGFISSQLEWFPSPFLSSALDQLVAIVGPGAQDPLHHKHKARHDFVGVARYPAHDATAASGQSPIDPGVTLLTSYWPDRNWLPGLRLIDHDGRTLHTWNVDIRAIWPTSPHLDPNAGSMNQPFNCVHGSHLFENGDVIFNVQYLGLLRMNAQGKVLWRLDRRTHHSVQLSEDGNFWVCSNRWVPPDQVKTKFPGLEPPLAEDFALLVSPQGQILREISLLRVLYDSSHRSLLWTSQHQAIFDITHLNDVEPLPTSMASQYPIFAAGDLLVSLRNHNLVCVLDPRTGRIKWSAPGQFIEQHDPDFIGDGWISVFDNRTDDTPDGRRYGGSRLVAVRPHTGEMRQIYPRKGSSSKHERHFYTSRGGKAQLLPNGHWLITESTAGRVFEIDREGNTVWEWGQQRHKDGMISEVLEGTRYPFTTQTVKGWSRNQ